jgi:hypothetical protein
LVFFGTYIILNYAEGSISNLVATGMKKTKTEIELRDEGPDTLPFEVIFLDGILAVKKR